MTNLQALKTKYAEMGEEIAKLEGEEWPKEGDLYWWVSDQRSKATSYWTSSDRTDYARKSIGNIFRTEAEANLHKLRLESMAKRWLPEAEEAYYYARPEEGVKKTTFDKTHTGDLGRYWIGNCHKTEQEAKEWRERYGEAFAIPAVAK